jgi:uncharacterized repeat protein (TIGR04076 family)
MQEQSQPKRPYRIEIKLISAEGKCPNGHKVGDEWNVFMKTPDKPMCLVAFYNLFNPIRVLETGGSWPMYADTESFQTTCPDTRNRLLFEVRRFPVTDMPGGPPPEREGQ